MTTANHRDPSCRALFLALLAAAGLSACNSGSGSAGAPDTVAPGGSTGTGGGGVTGSATLSWQPPQTNTDGTALTNLVGYYIHYGTNSSSLDLQLKVDAGLTRYVIDNLASGTWYFAISSYNSAGIESAMSAIVSKTI
jgi:hypothetical protein